MIGKLLDHRYQVIRVLATGGFGQTYIAQDTRRPGNPICVVKHLKPASSDPRIFVTAKRLFQSEAETLERLGSHDQIPRLLAYFDENQEFFLVQEFIDGHTLAEELIPGQRWTQSQVLHLLQEILGILEFVHQQGVIHRDIKPDNIIRRASDYKLVLVDFGSVKQLRSPFYGHPSQTPLLTIGTLPTATVAIGTPGYMPTEQGQGKPRPNSDIYSLGIIAIQALTGVPSSQLPEDPDTGEIIWQNLAPVSNDLATVLSKMVRYHFKDRYQNATDTLQACRELASAPSFTPATSPLLQPNYQPSSKPPTSQVLPQQTIALAPPNHSKTKAPTHPTTVEPQSKDSSKPDPLPLLIGILLAGGVAALVTNVSPNFKNFIANLMGNDTTPVKNCLAVVAGNSNIRSEPSSINSDNVVQTVGNNTKFLVTGKRTKQGWVEVQLNSGKLAWAHSDVIANNEQWVSCLRDKGIATQIVDDSTLITERPVPKLQPKSSIVSSVSDPTDKSTAEAGKTETEQPPDDQATIVEQARQKYESGDLQGAITTLKSIPGNAAAGIKETAIIMNQWQQDWAKAEALSNEINHAIDNGQWDKVLAYKDHPEKLPNIKYWQDKLEPLFKQAAENVAKKALSQSEKPSNRKTMNIQKPTTQPALPQGGF
jgi:serine/threonine-protein kinase